MKIAILFLITCTLLSSSAFASCTYLGTSEKAILGMLDAQAAINQEYNEVFVVLVKNSTEAEKEDARLRLDEIQLEYIKCSSFLLRALNARK